MPLFNWSRKKQQSVLPDEVSQYYQSQRRERTGVALFLGIIALVITLLIGVGLFFGGRYVYRQFVDNDKETTDTVQTTEGQDQAEQPAQGQVEESQADSDSESSNTESTPGSSDVDESDTEATTSTPSSSTIPATGDDETLPRTGDEGM